MPGRSAHLKVAFVSAALFLSADNAAAASCAAEPFVRNAGTAIMGAARTRSAAAFSGVASRYADLRGIALFALGPHRASLAKSQEAEYVALTRVFIGRFMARHAGRFNGTGLNVTSCTGGGRALTVKVKLTGGQTVIFKLYKTRSGYRVQDLNVSSVWLAQQLRSTFTGVIRRNGGDVGALLAFLRG